LNFVSASFYVYIIYFRFYGFLEISFAYPDMLEDDGCQMIDDLEVEGLCTHALGRWEFQFFHQRRRFFTVAWKLETEYCRTQKNKSPPDLLASTELTIGNKLTIVSE
jgi:hypothetical protein